MAFQLFPSSIYDTYPLNSLKALPGYADLIVYSACFFHVIFLTGGLLSHYLSSHYRNLSSQKKGGWCIHIVSFTFSCFAIYNGLKFTAIPELIADPLFGVTDYTKQILAISTGYFLWDTLISITYVSESGVAMVLHGASCFTVFFLTFQPYTHSFGKTFLLFEVSTIFLNIHWFCDKTGRSGSTLQWINGMCLLASFLFFRLIWGTYSMIEYIIIGYMARDQVAWFIYPLYALCALTLGGLNFYWYSIMIRSVMSRFQNKDTHKKVE
ncbi:TLC domain-containing protein [Globomyces pollinis-pini]|nr:TLC domain-containing protein [Globomyces pollinis-pini]